jgi:hypothetical protein
LDGDFQQDNPALFARFQCGKLLPVKIAQMNARLSFVLYIHDWYVRSLDGGAKNRNFVTTLPTDS